MKKENEEFLLTTTGVSRFGGNEVVCANVGSISENIKTESTRILSNFNFQRTKTLLYENNLKKIAFFFTFFKD